MCLVMTHLKPKPFEKPKSRYHSLYFVPFMAVCSDLL